MARPAQLQMGDTKRSTWSEICISHKEILSYLASSAFYPFANKNLQQQQQQQNIQRGSVSWRYTEKKKKKRKSPGNTAQYFLKYHKQNKTKIWISGIF